MNREPGHKRTALLLDNFFTDPDQYLLSPRVPLWVLEDYRSIEPVSERQRELQFVQKNPGPDARLRRLQDQQRQLQRAVQLSNRHPEAPQTQASPEPVVVKAFQKTPQ